MASKGKTWLALLKKPLNIFLHKTDFEIKVDDALNQIGTQSALITGFSFAIMMQELSSINKLGIFSTLYLILSAITIILELFVTFGSGVLAISVKPNGNPNAIPQSTIYQIWWAYMIGIIAFAISVFLILYDKLHILGNGGAAISLLILFLMVIAIFYSRNLMRTIHDYQNPPAN
ncbi:hypothetical protein [Crocosphaera sp.]|uniref:hypothetical protein n=1 Tax=Crocosphaera sp. TaxID=2729996 RepID=UPI002619E9DF|nr:hypothetical protein [Crocosphaera sp.]MDJ0579499.1 hypothetical protein [Crocosphaera sp.]